MTGRSTFPGRRNVKTTSATFAGPTRCTPVVATNSWDLERATPPRGPKLAQANGMRNLQARGRPLRE